MNVAVSGIAGSRCQHVRARFATDTMLLLGTTIWHIEPMTFLDLENA